MQRYKHFLKQFVFCMMFFRIWGFILTAIKNVHFIYANDCFEVF